VAFLRDQGFRVATSALPPPRRTGSAAASIAPPSKSSTPVAAPISPMSENACPRAASAAASGDLRKAGSATVAAVSR